MTTVQRADAEQTYREACRRFLYACFRERSPEVIARLAQQMRKAWINYATDGRPHG